MLRLFGLEVAADRKCAERYEDEAGGRCFESSFPLMRFGGRKADYVPGYICISGRSAEPMDPVRLFREALRLGFKAIPIESLVAVAEKLGPLERLAEIAGGYTLLDIDTGDVAVILADGRVKCRAEVKADKGLLNALYMLYVQHYASMRRGELLAGRQAF
jgi:hypothetical protein